MALSRKSKRNRRAGDPERRSVATPAAASAPVSRLLDPRLAAAFAIFSLVGLLVYQRALDGDFISDDQHYVRDNPYVHAFYEPDNWIAIWNPASELTILVENYAPVHLILHGIEWQVFGDQVQGYHVVNVLLHALAAVMLVPVFRRSGIGLRPALLGAAVFLLHPANVESVAWISQLKSSSALVLSLGALLLHPARPVVATLLFALALFAKPFSAFALVVVALFGWVGWGRSASDEASDFRWRWLGAWSLVLLLFAVAEVGSFSRSAGLAPPLYADPVARYLTIPAVALRYLLMAATGSGLSTFHEPPPVSSPLDPWLLSALVVLGLLGWRLWICLRRRSAEAVFWLWAVVNFAPLSGVVPLPYPMADRYLYFILPGLIGAVLHAAPEIGARLASRLGGAVGPDRLGTGAALVVVAAIGVFALQSHERAAVYRSAETLMAEAERNYPHGAAANTRKASRAAQQGRFEEAVHFLALARARGYNRLDHILQDPSYGPMQGYPPFVALKEEMAREWLGRLGRNAEPSQVELRAMAQAQIVLEDLPAALELIERGIATRGPITDDLRSDAEMLRREIGLRERLRAERARRAEGATAPH